MRKILFVLISFFYVLSFSANSQIRNGKGILVYFTDGVTTESATVLGKTVKKTNITKATLRKSLEDIAISVDSVEIALPSVSKKTHCFYLNSLCVNAFNFEI